MNYMYIDEERGMAYGRGRKSLFKFLDKLEKGQMVFIQIETNIPHNEIWDSVSVVVETGIFSKLEDTIKTLVDPEKFSWIVSSIKGEI